MSKSISKQVWLLDLINKNQPITFKEINDKWCQNKELNPNGKNMFIRTFHRNKKEIKNLFGIEIKCKKAFNQYYINQDYEDSKEELRSWILETISIDNMIKENKGLRKRILFEKMQKRESYLTIIIEAMKDNTEIEITYKRFASSEQYSTTLSPYFVKSFSQRWYVIGVTPRHPGEIRTYALDRILNLELTNNHFIYPKNFSPNDYFANSIGIFHSETPASPIILKVFGTTRKYIQTLPFHSSQVEIECNEEKDYSLFMLNVSIDEDLIREILKNGNNISVVSPDILKTEIISRLKKTLNNYQNEK